MFVAQPLPPRSRTSIASYSSKERTASAGQHSYDSGVWVGPGNETEMEILEQANYNPPSSRDISMTPRPSTSIVSANENERSTFEHNSNGPTNLFFIHFHQNNIYY